MNSLKNKESLNANLMISISEYPVNRIDKLGMESKIYFIPELKIPRDLINYFKNQFFPDSFCK